MKHFNLRQAILNQTGTELLQARTERLYTDRERLQRIIKNAVETELTKKQRNLIMLHYAKQYSLAQIADLLGCGKSSVSRMHKRALDRLTYAIYYLYYKS